MKKAYIMPSIEVLHLMAEQVLAGSGPDIPVDGSNTGDGNEAGGRKDGNSEDGSSNVWNQEW